MNTTDLQNDLKEFQEDLEEYGNYRYSYFIEVTCNMDLFFKKRQYLVRNCMFVFFVLSNEGFCFLLRNMLISNEKTAA